MRATSSFASDFGSTAHLEVGNMDPRPADENLGRAHKKRRLIQLGSSPPPFTTALDHHGRKRVNRTDTALTSPKATRKRRVAAAPTKHPLELRSSSPASPPPDEPRCPVRITVSSHELQPRARSEADTGNRSMSRDLLQRKRQLDRIDPSSPIGTFGGQLIGRSDRSLGPSRFGSADPATLARRPKRTVGLPTAEHPTPARSRIRSKTRSAPVADNENVEATVQQAGKASKHAAGEKLAKQRRRRPKIQRVQLGNTPPSSPAADLPLSDADHQLNSQPDAAEHLQPGPFDAADESEISYFPTLPPARHTSTEERNAADTTDGQVTSTPPSRISDHPPSFSGQNYLVAPTSNSVRLEHAAGQFQTLAHQSDHSSEGDSSVGLLQVLSQSAMRRVEPVQAADTESPQGDGQSLSEPALRAPSPPKMVTHQVNVDFDASHFTRAQAEQIANSIVGRESRQKQWMSVHPDFVDGRRFGSRLRISVTGKTLQAAWQPPSTHIISRDLGLSSSQLMRKSGSERHDFAHRNVPSEDAQNQDNEDLESFVHGFRFAGYRRSCISTCTEAADAQVMPHLQPFNAEALHKRMQTCRKEVVKIIVPFSEPSLSTRATRACFVAPHQTPTASGSRASPSDNSVMLVWMQSTAQRFLHALEAMLQAGFPRSTQTQSYRIDSNELALYLCPILHYVAHVGSYNFEGKRMQFSSQKKRTPSYVALYVHLDRIQEARQKLAALELGHDADVATQSGSYRPFNDPALRLLVTSMKGEPLCLI